MLVSLDGFRWDYAKRDGAKNLLALGKKGVWAPEGMLPSYPSLTFPNHFTIVTGLYPEHHGLVANSFYDENLTALMDMIAAGKLKPVIDKILPLEQARASRRSCRCRRTSRAGTSST